MTFSLSEQVCPLTFLSMQRILLTFLFTFFCKIKDNGKVIKAVRTDAGQPVVIEEIQVFPVSVPVTNMMIHRGKMGGGADGSSEEPRLVVSSQSEIASLKLQRCYSDKVSTCR